MSGKGREILEELRSVLSGKTLDAILPSLFFVVFNNLLGLEAASVIAISTALFFGVYRLRRKQNARYAFGGLLGVVIAVVFAYFAGSAADFFLPRIISSGAMVLVSLLTLFTRKPLAAWISHLTRGWPMDWFRRPDVLPAYREVTILWTLLMALRFMVQLQLYRGNDLNQIFVISTLMGTPGTIFVLVLSYVYGIWRLKNLQGPGVDEYLEGKPAPWRGQNRGF